MKIHLVLCAAIVALTVACGGGTRSDQRSFTLQGQVQSIDAGKTSAVIKHEEIKGFMPGMTMPYEVRDPKLLDGLAPGDLINATLIVESNAAYLSTIKKVGSAPLEAPAAEPVEASASSGFELLKQGEEVPDAPFKDQDGKKRQFKSFVGKPTVITFMYTKCPMPTFCPLLDRNFAAIQKSLSEDPALAQLKGRVQLVSISFDPITDTPPVLKDHATKLNADPKVWTFLTGDRDDIDQFGAHFGVQVARAMDDPLNITHNLRTAVIDKDGKLVKTFTGNEWTPQQVIDELKTVAQ
jgi:protein SCO1/2